VAPAEVPELAAGVAAEVEALACAGNDRWNGPVQQSLSISVASTSFRPMFGRIVCSR
jgi:hypothetical protein